MRFKRLFILAMIYLHIYIYIYMFNNQQLKGLVEWKNNDWHKFKRQRDSCILQRHSDCGLYALTSLESQCGKRTMLLSNDDIVAFGRLRLMTVDVSSGYV